LCYYIRLTDESKRTNFEVVLRPLLLKLINNDKSFDETDGNLLEQIKNEELNKEILRNGETIDKFSDFLMTEEDFILDLIDLDKGIGKNTLLKENVLLLFLSVITNIPLIIIGKPGTGKSLSAQLIYKSLRGKYSKNEFFQLFPKLIQIYFQGSESTDPDDVLNLFDRAKKKIKSFYKGK
jgi:Cdc6-like AAA superfamily ATPase